jgi:hypothetical protein
MPRHCITVHVSESDLEALVARSYLPEEASSDRAAIKADIQCVIGDLEFVQPPARLETQPEVRPDLGAILIAGSPSGLQLPLFGLRCCRAREGNSAPFKDLFF